MGTPLQSSVPLTPHSALGKVRAGAVACLCLWAGASAGAAPDSPAAAAGAYRQAAESFNREDYGRALELLERAPEAGKSGEQADVWNLRGAIYLHQRRYDQARAAFTKAVEKDAGLWAARFNLAEVNFRQGKYAESSRQFEELLGRTSRWTQSDERGFLQYKLLLTQMLAGNDKPAQAYIQEHRGDRAAPLMYYYLNAAREHRRGHGRQAEAWLAQGDAHYSPGSEQVFAESFRSLGWDPERTDRLIAAAHRHDASSTTPAALAVVELIPGQAPAETPVKMNPATSPAKPDFRLTAPAAPMTSPGDFASGQTPPLDEETGSDLPDDRPSPAGAPRPAVVEDAAQNAAPGDSRAVYARPIVLGRPGGTPARSKATPAASAAPSASPDATSAASATPSASATPGATPRADFVEKYEQAYVKFVEKNYAEARRLLDEADAIQPGQTTSFTLRGEIFKHYYGEAYAAYKKPDYAAALASLDEADLTQPNQPDALNLRGLTCSKQKDYAPAESAFRRAIDADPQFWAARFNYAELPFNYLNYKEARARFEELSTKTDASKQPRESELTQYKIFLTFLLEGKEDEARSFMGHLAFTGTTPARYFCQAALEFHAGHVDKAQAEINSANKEYQPRLVDIFKESFYRIGWLNDPANPAGAAPSTALADAAPLASPAPSPVASPLGSPALALATPGVSPTPAAAAASPALALTSPPPAPETAPTPSSSMALAQVPAPSASPSVEASDTPAPMAAATETRRPRPSKNENLARLLLIGFVVVSFAYNCIRLFAATLNRQSRRPMPIRRSPLYADRPEAEQPDKVEAPR